MSYRKHLRHPRFFPLDLVNRLQLIFCRPPFLIPAQTRGSSSCSASFASTRKVRPGHIRVGGGGGDVTQSAQGSFTSPHSRESPAKSIGSPQQFRHCAGPCGFAVIPTLPHRGATRPPANSGNQLARTHSKALGYNSHQLLIPASKWRG